MQTLGGTVKLGTIVEEINLTDLDPECFAEIIASKPRGDEVVFGLTAIGGTTAMQKRFKKLPLELKKILKNNGLRCRWVTGKDDGEISPAAVAKLKLTTEGYDFVCVIHEGKLYIGLTTHVQDADAWSLRDYGRPMRNDRAGMLPPKLARMMVNMAQIEKGETLLDPFCGNGAVLMEAALASQPGLMIGSDIEEEQTDSCKENLDWLVKEKILTSDDAKRTNIFPEDVRDLADHIKPSSIDVVVTEGTLGPPLRGSESKQAIERNAGEVSKLWIDALRTLHPLLKPHARLVIIWPSYKTDGGLARVQLDDEMSDLGYAIVNPLAGWDDSGNPLLYHRQGQHVARRIVVLKKGH